MLSDHPIFCYSQYNVVDEYRAYSADQEVLPECSIGEVLFSSILLVESREVLRNIIALVRTHILLEPGVIDVRTSSDYRVKVHQVPVLPEGLPRFPAVETEEKLLQSEDCVLEEEIVHEVRRAE